MSLAVRGEIQISAGHETVLPAAHKRRMGKTPNMQMQIRNLIYACEMKHLFLALSPPPVTRPLLIGVEL